MSFMRRWYTIVPFALLVSLTWTACLKENRPTAVDPFALLEISRAQKAAEWVLHKPETYCYHMRCTAEAVAPVYQQTVRVLVDHDTVRSVKTLSDSSIDKSHWAAANTTIDGLFGLVGQGILGRYETVEVQYDDLLSFPTQIELDPKTAVADDEIFYSISALRDTVYVPEDTWNPDPPILPGRPSLP